MVAKKKRARAAAADISSWLFRSHDLERQIVGHRRFSRINRSADDIAFRVAPKRTSY
jgi:hypothetical protein